MSIIFGALYMLIGILMCIAVYGMLSIFDFSIKKLWRQSWLIRIDFAVFIAVLVSCVHGFLNLFL